MNPETSNAKQSVKVTSAIAGCLVLLVSFFFPWVSFLGSGVAGYDIPHLSSAWAWLWLIPGTSALAILLGLVGRRHTEVAQVAGALPLVALAVALYQNGQELFSALRYGAYGALLCGVFLILFAPQIDKCPDVKSSEI